MILALLAGWLWASGMEPCTTFTSADGRLFDIGAAYAASDLVAIGRVETGNGLTLRVSDKLKGSEGRKAVPLSEPKCAGTACGGGFSVAPGVDLLFLLSKRPDGVYDSVTGNGNFSCPVVFEAKKSGVRIGKKVVPLKTLKKYLESKPKPFALF